LISRILIAEDDLTARTILTGLLKKWGYQVTAVNDGQAAWEQLNQPDAPLLVILDWVMPGLDGLDVIKLVRAKVVDQEPYIILLTSKDQKGDVYSGLESGANDYIKKPFDIEELFARLRVGERSLELQARLFETQQNLEHLATHDPLTGVLNRRAVLDQLSRELSRAERCENTGVSIGFFDIDFFKQINDQYGHQAGDEVLKAIVELLLGKLRPYDTFGRLGGDEFLIIAPETHEENSENLFERLASAVAGLKIKTGAGEVSVTASIGVARAGKHTDLDHLLDEADAAMYQAKQAGRNQVSFHTLPG